MDDELEDKILYQTYLSHMKLVSKFAVGIPTAGISTPLGYFWRIARTYLMRPETLLLSIILFIIFIYVQAVDTWSRISLVRIQHTLGRTALKVSKLQLFVNNSTNEKLGWGFKEDYIAAYAVQGHRLHMEDRFVVNSDINNTGVSLFAIFDGHGGEFAANYARDKLIPNISEQIIKLKNHISGKDSQTIQDDKINKDKQVKLDRPDDLPKIDIVSYLDGDKINYGKLLTDEVLAADKLLVAAAKKNKDVAGTTALIAVLEGNKLTVANVGDSRGVMCDGKGNAIPLSFDHKPQQQRERTRINKAGGDVTFKGVWRVAGILATSRALGDYPLKDNKLVIAEPDILTFDLDDHDPSFLILASDGLWDTFSNQEAVAFIKKRIDEPHFGAKSITLRSFSRGSLDNITVLVINLKNRIQKSEAKTDV